MVLWTGAWMIFPCIDTGDHCCYPAAGAKYNPHLLAIAGKTLNCISAAGFIMKIAFMIIDGSRTLDFFHLCSGNVPAFHPAAGMLCIAE